jgi:N-methylhydantoinase B
MAACNLGLRRLESLFDKYGKDVVLSAMEHVLDDAEAKCRRVVEKIPNGHYEAESFYEDSFSGRMGGPSEPIRIHASVTISGSDMTIDFSGCSGQRPSAFNSRTKAGAYIPYKAITTPLDPVNEGSFRALKVIIPEGSIMMAKYPAPMSHWSLILPTVVDTVLKALAPAMRDRIPAGHLGTLGSPVVFFGTVPRTGERFIVQSLEGGGWGGRPFEDGPSSSISIIQGDVRNSPAENMELKCPVVINERALRVDSGGPGKFRGGLGLSVRVTNLVGGRWTLGYLGKENFPPWGLWGGKPGQAARDYLKLSHETEFMQVNVMRHFVAANSQAIINSGSGGGWGNPLERDPERVALDVREGYVSLQAAEKDYGVVLGSDMTVNYEETTKLRQKLKAASV